MAETMMGGIYDSDLPKEIGKVLCTPFPNMSQTHIP